MSKPGIEEVQNMALVVHQCICPDLYKVWKKHRRHILHIKYMHTNIHMYIIIFDDSGYAKRAERADVHLRLIVMDVSLQLN